MYKPMKKDLWRGRVDDREPTPALRWHQQVKPLSEQAEAGIALLGVCSDEGVRRNQGREGARRGPDAIRQMMANQAWQLDRPLYDAGNLYCDGDQLEPLSEQQAGHVQRLLEQDHFPLLLGGGHEIAYGSFLGLARYGQQHIDGPIGILNFDAHFDLRLDHRPSSGTPFLQIADWCAEHDRPFHYGCLGISELSNTQALFQRADQLGVNYLLDEQINPWQLQPVMDWLDAFLEPLAALYLTIDLDVLPAATMPGVSAPAARGVPLELVETLIAELKLRAGERLRLADLAELNPDKDIDNRSARVAARLCHQILKP